MISKQFAIEKHKNRYGEFPYIYHLDKVNEIIQRFGFTRPDEKYLTDCAYLHDILEDTNATPDEIVSKFSANVLKIVKNLTDEPGENRKIRKERTYPKIKGKHDETIIKLADRIANIEHGMYIEESSKIIMYINEMEEFFEGIYDKKVEEEDRRIRNMWNLLIMYYAIFYGGDFFYNYRKLTKSV